jgi:hypothetical protein
MKKYLILIKTSFKNISNFVAKLKYATIIKFIMKYKKQKLLNVPLIAKKLLTSIRIQGLHFIISAIY